MKDSTVKKIDCAEGFMGFDNLPRKVLVADDSEVQRGLLGKFLQRQGFEVVMAGDGDEAWEIMNSKTPPPIVILDWSMPGRTGVEICRRARQNDYTRRLYIILLTANQEKEMVVEGLEAGANDYILKPFSSEELRARIGVGVRVQELQFELSRKCHEVQAAMEHIRSLEGILPICMHCHKIRTDGNAWDRLEKYIEEHSEAQFSHSLCPECLEKHHPEPSD